MLNTVCITENLLDKLGNQLSKDQSFLERYIDKKLYTVANEIWLNGGYWVADRFLDEYMKNSYRNKTIVTKKIEGLFDRYHIKYDKKFVCGPLSDEKDSIEYFNSDKDCRISHQIEID